jgi:hypothetical protein
MSRHHQIWGTGWVGIAIVVGTVVAGGVDVELGFRWDCQFGLSVGVVSWSCRLVCQLGLSVGVVGGIVCGDGSCGSVGGWGCQWS